MDQETKSVSLEMAALTHKGMVREKNEDSMYYNPGERIMIVCDGMGGHAGGNVASDIAMRVVSHHLRSIPPENRNDEDYVIETMKGAVFAANDEILRQAHSDPDLEDMGTTICAGYFMDDQVVFGHVGDSRIYRKVKDELFQISEDHSLVAEQVRAGLLDPDSEQAKALSSILTRALGMDQIVVDVIIEDLCPGDLYLFCSDGLTDMVEEDELLDILIENENLTAASMKCVKQANEYGGFDNITVGLTQALS